MVKCNSSSPLTRVSPTPAPLLRFLASTKQARALKMNNLDQDLRLDAPRSLIYFTIYVDY